MSFGFPANPSNKKQYISNGKTFEYDGVRESWIVSTRSPVTANTTTVTDVSQLADPDNLLSNASSTLPVYATEESLYASTADLDVGQMAYVSENGKIAIWNGNSWLGATTVEHVPFVAGTYYGDRAIVASGSTMGQHNEIDYFDLTTPGSAIDFGDLTIARSYTRGASDGTYAVFSGGQGNSGSDTLLEYVTIATANDATTFGTLTREYSLHGSIGDGTYGYAMGGYRITANLDIDRWTMATPGNSSDVGNLTNTVSQFGVWGNGDRTLLTGGSGGGVDREIEYISLQNLSSGASDFGNLTVQRKYCYSTGDSTRAVMAGGRNASDNDYSDVIDYVTIDTPGNATSFGTLGQTIIEHTATSNLTYGAWTGGSVGGGPGGGGTYNAQINYLTIQTTGTSTDHGDLTVARNNPGSTSGSPS